MKSHRLSGQAIVEWALCVPVLMALMSFFFGFLMLGLGQIQLEDLSGRTVEVLAHSRLVNDADLQQTAIAFVSERSPWELTVRIDRHLVEETSSTAVAEPPPIEIIGLELSRPLPLWRDLRLRAYARAVRVL